MSTVVDAQPPADLVAKINAEHQAFVESYRKSLEHAIRCGNMLYEVRRRLPPGTWLGWLDGNFHGSRTMAQEYLSLANAHHQDPQAVSESAVTSARNAFGYIARKVGGPRSFEGDQVPARLPSGAPPREPAPATAAPAADPLPADDDAPEYFGLTFDDLVDLVLAYSDQTPPARHVSLWLEEHGHTT